MITVTLGTIPFAFNRTINWLDMLLQRGVISEEVFVQYGVSDVSPLAKYPFVTTESIVENPKLREKIANSRLIISHAGQGSARLLSSMKTSFVLVPRLACYHEHIDDHQLWFARGVKAMGVSYCLSMEHLEQAILNPPPQFHGKLFEGPKLAEHLLQRYPSSVLKIA